MEFVKLTDGQKGKYLPVQVTSNLTLETTADGVNAVVNGTACPVFDEAFWLRLVQARSQDPVCKGHGGEWYFPELGEFHKELRLLPICIVRYSRAYYASGYNAKASMEEMQPTCRSNDGRVPARNAKEQQCDRCCDVKVVNGREHVTQVCPMSMWQSNKPSPCTLTTDVAFLDITDPTTPKPVRVQFRRSGSYAFNAYNKTYERLAKVAKVRRQSMESAVTVLTSDYIDDLYYVPKFDVVFEQGVQAYSDLRLYYRDMFFEWEKRQAFDGDDDPFARYDAPGDMEAIEVPVSDVQASEASDMPIDF